MTNSVRSKSSNHSSRAVSILDQIKTQTTPTVYKEFLGEMALYRQQKIDAADLERRLGDILIDYPLLLKQFQSSMPSSPPTQKFKSALVFVNKVKQAYLEEPRVYHDFVNFMKEFQTGGCDREYVLRKVSELLKDQPRLVKEFSEFYQNGVNGGRETLNPNVNNNVDVGRPMKPTDSSDTLMSGDGPITQARIISEQSQAVAPTPEVVEVVVNDEVVVSETTPLLGSDLESQMQVTASNTKFYAMVGGFTTFVLVGSSLSYALMNGYITALPW